MSKVPPELGEWCCDAPINPARERHFQCESPTGSPLARHASTRTISCRMRGWYRCSGWPRKPGSRRSSPRRCRSRRRGSSPARRTRSPSCSACVVIPADAVHVRPPEVSPTTHHSANLNPPPEEDDLATLGNFDERQQGAAATSTARSSGSWPGCASSNSANPTGSSRPWPRPRSRTCACSTPRWPTSSSSNTRSVRPSTGTPTRPSSRRATKDTWHRLAPIRAGTAATWCRCAAPAPVGSVRRQPVAHSRFKQRRVGWPHAVPTGQPPPRRLRRIDQRRWPPPR